MFAAASGARLAHRHNKTVKKQISASQIEGLQVHCKSYPSQQHIKYPDIHGNRFAGIPHRRPNYSSKLYYDSNHKLSSSYTDINGRIAKLEYVDLEGKAAWQDRELNHEPGARESISIQNEVANTHRTKQREAHRRWVKRNRIHDSSFGDCSSDEEFFYGVQNGAANLLLYVGLGTMCIGMIITFVGTGEKGFKTMELKLIGPSLIGAGVLIIILRIMLCFCPSGCLRLRKHKHKLKNSTDKLNSEGDQLSQDICSSREPLDEDSNKNTEGKSQEGKKRVSIAMLPMTSGLSTNSSGDLKSPKTRARLESGKPSAVPVLHVENEKPKKLKEGMSKKSSSLFGDYQGEMIIDMRCLNGSDGDITSDNSSRRTFQPFSESIISSDDSDVSLVSLVHISPFKETKKRLSKFDIIRGRKNIAPIEIVLSPSNLNGTKRKK